MDDADAVIVGAGPNGLAAAITLARAGRKVVVLESAETIGGGCRSAELTLPGFVHDVCSAVHPLAVVSPLFQSLPLAAHGLEWIEPPAMFAHPLENGGALCVYRSVERTAEQLGADGAAYRRVFEPLVDGWPDIFGAFLRPLSLPRHPLAVARFGLQAMRPAVGFARRTFTGDEARSLFGGVAAHSMLPLDMRPTAGVGLMLTLMAHVAGWCLPKGGAQSLTNALVSHLRSLGGEIVTGVTVASLDELPPAKAVLCDLLPGPFLRLAGSRLPAGYRRALQRYRYGMGVYKVDWALDAPIPWRHPDCALAGTVHIGGGLREIVAAEHDAWNGRPSARPFVLLSQPTLFDLSRAPQDRHTAWTYCHVPHGSDADMLPRIEQQIERYAPGFRDRVIARAVMRPAEIEQRNPNFVGGDIGAGAATLGQLLTRPTWRTHSTPLRGVYLCSASTPPGVGVHGMCGYFAAQLALREVLRE